MPGGTRRKTRTAARMHPCTDLDDAVLPLAHQNLLQDLSPDGGRVPARSPCASVTCRQTRSEGAAASSAARPRPPRRPPGHFVSPRAIDGARLCSYHRVSPNRQGLHSEGGLHRLRGPPPKPARVAGRARANTPRCFLPAASGGSAWSYRYNLLHHGDSVTRICVSCRELQTKGRPCRRPRRQNRRPRFARRRDPWPHDRVRGRLT